MKRVIATMKLDPKGAALTKTLIPHPGYVTGAGNDDDRSDLPPRKVRAKAQQPEHYEQATFIKMCRALPAGRYPFAHLIYAIPNASKRTAKLAAWMIAEGLVSGTPDLHLPVPTFAIDGLAMVGLYRTAASLYIEMKDPAKFGTKAGEPTGNQLARHHELRQAGNVVVTAWGANAALAAVIEYYHNRASERMKNWRYEPLRFPPTVGYAATDA